MSARDDWISAHLHFSGQLYGEDGDRVLVDRVIPVVDRLRHRDLITNAFFVRYSERGPHIRLRLECASGDVHPEVEEHIHGLATVAPGDELVPAIDRIDWVPYEREVARYGGAQALRVAEHFFGYSTMMAIETLRDERRSDPTWKLGRGLATMVVLLRVFCDDPSSAAWLSRAYCDGYMKSYARTHSRRSEVLNHFESAYAAQESFLSDHVVRAWHAVDEVAPPSDPLERYVAGLRTTRRRLEELRRDGLLRLGTQRLEPRQWRDVVRTIGATYMHMTSNRLGLIRSQEIYVAYLLWRCLEPLGGRREAREAV